MEKCLDSGFRRNDGRSHGQVVVEVLLILPFFLLLVFTTMEIGHLAFRTILIHHAAYEVARIGSLTAKPDYASPGCQAPTLDRQKMQSVGSRILLNSIVSVNGPLATLQDQQEGCMNYDVEVTMTENVSLIFPMTTMFLGTPRGSRHRTISGAVRMPIERPLFK